MMQKLGHKHGRRLLVVANRLPVNVSICDNGEIEMEMASGGLVAGLNALSKSIEFHWYGWPGTDIHRNDREEVSQQLTSRFNASPVFLNKQIVEEHYNGFSSTYKL
jgi:trehalose 6-phosphate synthase